MADLLSSTSGTSAADESSPRVIGLEDDEASGLLPALSSGTVRRVFAAPHEESTNATKLAGRAGTLLRDVQRRLRKLDDAGLVEVVDTVYSEKGRETKVYTPVDRSLVIIAADEEMRARLTSMLSGLLGGVAVLTLLSAFVQWITTRGIDVLGGGGSAAESADVEAISTIATKAASATAQVIPPGLASFAGGLATLFVAAVVQFARRQSPAGADGDRAGGLR